MMKYVYKIICSVLFGSLATNAIAFEKIDCIYNLQYSLLQDSYFPFEDSEFASAPDGEYIVTILSEYRNKDFYHKKMATPTMLKVGSLFTSMHSHQGNLNLTPEQVEIVKSGMGESKCEIKSIIPK